VDKEDHKDVADREVVDKEMVDKGVVNGETEKQGAYI
jgi:hypothetical protein